MSILSAEEDYVDDFNSFTVESASKYINFNKSAEALFDDDLKSLPNTETYIPGSELEGGTSLENYMRESDLASPLKERKDDAMQFVSAAQLTKSVVYEDDYDMEDFDLLSVRANETIGDRELSTPQLSKSKQRTNRPARPPQQNQNQNIRDREKKTAVPKSPASGRQRSKKPVKSIFQYHVPPPVIKSKVANENKLSFATIESQLATALKKIEAYSKLNKILVRKLDATSIDEEMGRYKTALGQQDELIARLVEDNKNLQKIIRDQSRQLDGHERLVCETGVVVSTDGQLKVMSERLRRVHQQLSESRQKEAERAAEVDELSSDNKKLRKKLANSKRVVAELKGQSIDGDEVDDAISPRSVLSSPKKAKAIVELQEKLLKAEEKNMHLERQIQFYKNDFDRQVNALKSDASLQRERMIELEKEVEAKDRLSRVQVVEVKRLQQACKDLAEGNKKLHLASDMYTRVQADSNQSVQTGHYNQNQNQIQHQPASHQMNPQPPPQRRSAPHKSQKRGSTMRTVSPTGTAPVNELSIDSSNAPSL